MNSFTDPHARTDFWAFCAATFLGFVTLSTLAYLSVLLTDQGHSTVAIGSILASAFLPTLAATLLVGHLASKWSVLQIALIGKAICLATFVAMNWFVDDAWALGALRATMGLGYGLFFTAAMIHARSLLTGPNTAYLFGIFSSMLPLPNIIGPALAEHYHHLHGAHGFFVVLAIPLAASLVLLVWLLYRNRARSATQVHPGAGSYAEVLRNRAIYLPVLGALIIGFLWGFVASFLAYFLNQRGIPTAYFFSVSTAALFISRFTIFKAVQKLSKPHGVALGFALMAVGNAIVFVSGSTGTAIGAVLFGVGYGFVFPLLSTWVSDQYTVNQRAKPSAVFNLFFQLGISSIPLISGWIIQNHSPALIFIALTGTSLLFSAALCLFDRRSQSRGLCIDALK